MGWRKIIISICYWKNGERVGYRYTALYSEDIIKKFKDHKLDKIFVLDMKNQNNNKSIVSYCIDEKHRHLVQSIKFSKIFKELFGEEVYSLYYNEGQMQCLKQMKLLDFKQFKICHYSTYLTLKIKL